MSAIHPKGTRLANQSTAQLIGFPTAKGPQFFTPNFGRAVSGKTKALRLRDNGSGILVNGYGTAPTAPFNQRYHTVNGQKVFVGGKSVASRVGSGLGLTGPTGGSHTVNGVTTLVSASTIAKRSAVTTGKSGKTIANRPVVNTSTPVANSSGTLGTTDTAIMTDPTTPTTGAKSGATIFNRNLTNLEVKIVETVIIGALIVGAIFLTKKYKLLQGGR